jgi:bifunctional non-homologous end joining protein LigD
VHIVIPLKPDHKFDKVKKAAIQIQQYLVDKSPNLFTDTQRKKKRNKKVFVDILRNEYGQTAITPYSMRAIKGAPIATPIEWEELNNKKLTPQKYNIKNIFQRLGKKEDPWRNIFDKAETLYKLIK